MILGRDTATGAMVNACRDVTATCPECDGLLVAKLGQLVVHHWAHRADADPDCDHGAGETDWHRGWKLRLQGWGGDLEVRRGNHRADVIMPSGLVIELQSVALDLAQARRREDHYGQRMLWLFDMRAANLHRGRSGGYWWKNGGRRQIGLRRPIWWHTPNDQVERVTPSTVPTRDGGGTRVLGRVERTLDVDSFARHICAGQPFPRLPGQVAMAAGWLLPDELPTTVCVGGPFDGGVYFRDEQVARGWRDDGWLYEPTEEVQTAGRPPRSAQVWRWPVWS